MVTKTELTKDTTIYDLWLTSLWHRNYEVRDVSVNTAILSTHVKLILNLDLIIPDFVFNSKCIFYQTLLIRFDVRVKKESRLTQCDAQRCHLHAVLSPTVWRSDWTKAKYDVGDGATLPFPVQHRDIVVCSIITVSPQFLWRIKILRFNRSTVRASFCLSANYQVK